MVILQLEHQFEAFKLISFTSGTRICQYWPWIRHTIHYDHPIRIRLSYTCNLFCFDFTNEVPCEGDRISFFSPNLPVLKPSAKTTML